MKAIQTANSRGGSLRFNLKNNHYIKLLSNINRTGLFSAFTFLLLALTCLFPISKSEQTTEAVTGTVQSSSLTLNVSSSAASVELDVNSNTGTFASSTMDNSAAFSVTTNNFSGYTLSISGSDNDGKLYDTTKKYFLEPLTSAVSEADFSSTSSLNGKWGYKPSKFNSIANNNYLPAPTTTASTLDTTSVANTTANDYTISLGLRADYTTTANTYSNSFIITAVPNPIAYVITYDANTTDTVSNMPAAQNSTTSATSITLADKTPVRENYDFKGWCTVAPTTANPDTCTGTTFQPGDTYGIDQTSENITVLYAIWEEQIAGYIQDYTYAQCEANAQNHAVKLIDKRDDKVYTARYINGVCTMIDNLRVDKGTLLTPADTNINSNWTMTDRDLTTGDNSYDLPEIHEGDATTGHWYNYAAATAGTITGSSNTTEATQDICPKGWKLPDGHNTGVAGATTLDQYKLANNNWQSYDETYQTVFNSVAAGYYYDGSLNSSGSDGFWWSSTASRTTGRYSLNYDTSNGLLSGYNGYRGRGFSVRCVKAKPGVTISFNANGGTGAMNMQKIDAGQSANLTANTFTRTDYVFTGWNTEPDGSGTSYSNAATYTAPASEDNKIVVLYAQWVPAMQSFTSDQCQSLATDALIILGDARDNKTYTVRYINGNCWMTQNLRIDSGTVLNPDTSNLAVGATYIIPTASLEANSPNFPGYDSEDPVNSYSSGRIQDSGDDTVGYWYNYVAASAGTITGSSNSEEAQYNICPKGWTLPSADQLYSLTDGSGNLSGQYFSVFSPFTRGYFYNGILNNSTSISQSYSIYWSSTANSSHGRFSLQAKSTGTLGIIQNSDPAFGAFVRCVRI